MIDRSGTVNFFATLTLSILACIIAIACTTVAMIGITVLAQGTEFWRYSASTIGAGVFLFFLWAGLRLLSLGTKAE